MDAFTCYDRRLVNRFEAAVALAEGKWRKISWRRGTKGRLTCLFAARRVRVAGGHKHCIADGRMQCMHGGEVWLVGERRSTGEQKCYGSNRPTDVSLKTLAATIKARWVCERAHQQTKEELGIYSAAPCLQSISYSADADYRTNESWAYRTSQACSAPRQH